VTRYLRACCCGIRVHLPDGQVRYIDSNPVHSLNEAKSIFIAGATLVDKTEIPNAVTALGTGGRSARRFVHLVRLVGTPSNTTPQNEKSP
jgi:hypothetical protein